MRKRWGHYARASYGRDWELARSPVLGYFANDPLERLWQNRNENRRSSRIHTPSDESRRGRTTTENKTTYTNHNTRTREPYRYFFFFFLIPLFITSDTLPFLFVSRSFSTDIVKQCCFWYITYSPAETRVKWFSTRLQIVEQFTRAMRRVTKTNMEISFGRNSGRLRNFINVCSNPEHVIFQ